MATAYLCRTSRPTKVYSSPISVNPASTVIPKGSMFISTNYHNRENLDFYEITNDEYNQNLPVGAWVAGDVIDCIPTDDFDTTNITKNSTNNEINETLFIKSNKITVYEDSQSTTTVLHELKLKDSLTVDRKADTLCNGVIQTRYHITAVNGSTSHPDVGKWILGDYAVDLKQTKVVFHTNRVQSRVANATTLDASARDATTGTTTTQTVDTTNSVDGVTASNADQELLNNAQMNQTDMDQLYQNYGFNYSMSQRHLMDVPIGRMTFVHGMPFQYTYLTDRREGNNNYEGQDSLPDEVTSLNVRTGSVDLYGRTFGKEIAANMPIVVIAPGNPIFLTNVKQGVIGYSGTSQSARNNWIPFFDTANELTGSEFDAALAELTNDNGDYQYYSMTIDTADYFNYVNAICQTSARLMGLTNFTYHGTTCDKLDWGKYNQSVDQDYSMFEEVIGVTNGVSFAFDPVSSITDSISNETSDSMFTSMLNEVSSKAREVEFVTGQVGIDTGLANYEGSTPTIGNSTIGNIASRIGSFLNNSIHGMNVRFPKIWNDSSSSKDYNIEMHFITPYATTFCKWRYVLVPFFHIFCLTAPRSIKTVMNYSRPFLIKAYSKGYFNVEMGIITSLQWKRFGDGDMISGDGVPTQIDVSVAFQDMYYQLAMSKMSGITGSFEMMGVFFNNNGLMEMLGTLSGVNMLRISLGERLSLFASSAVGAFSATGSNFMKHLSQKLSNAYLSLYYNN